MSHQTRWVAAGSASGVSGRCSSRMRAEAPSPRTTKVRPTETVPAGPALQRTTMGRSSRTPAGTAMTRSRSDRARATWPKGSSAGQRVVRLERRDEVAHGRRQRGREVRDHHAGACRIGADGATRAVVGSMSTTTDAPSGSVPPSTIRRARPARRDAAEARGAQVEVRREQLVRLTRQARHARQRVEARRQPPRGLAGSRGGRSRGLLGEERQGQRGHAHPSEPSISSLTSRLNSMAYSIGSSLVNTSRKPWTMRFCASFSVRPRLMR